MRRNFYELLSQRALDIKKEYAALWKLFCEEQCTTSCYTPCSLVQWIDKSYFRNLSFRGSFVSLDDMMDELGIYKHAAVDIEKLLLFCELIYAVVPGRGIVRDSKMSALIDAILQNIDYILEHTNHEFVKDPSGKSIIVEKNKTVTMAAQLVTDATVAFELIEYNHFAIRGHLSEKKKILVSVAGYIEPILNSKVLSAAGYKQLESNAGFVFNNFHIRHNNKEGAKANDYIATINNRDLEAWYDKAYELALSVIIMNDYLSIGKEIDDIKPKYAWRT